MTKVAVVGNRVGWQYQFIKEVLEKLEIDSNYTLVSGGAAGVDSFAEQYAREKGCKMIIYHPDPTKSIPHRFFSRNLKIAKECDWMVVFNKKAGASGSNNTFAYAKKLNKVVFLYEEQVHK